MEGPGAGGRVVDHELMPCPLRGIGRRGIRGGRLGAHEEWLGEGLGLRRQATGRYGLSSNIKGKGRAGMSRDEVAVGGADGGDLSPLKPGDVAARVPPSPAGGDHREEAGPEGKRAMECERWLHSWGNDSVIEKE